jgi:flagellar hook-associated protein 2
MANGVLGLGSGQASALNSDLIDKLKAAERKSTVEPIETSITSISTEKETFANIEAKVKELLEAIKPFDLFVSGGVTALEQKTATTSGDSVSFDAADIKALSKGTTSIDVTQLAQKDVFQSNSVNKSTKDSVINQGELVINGQTFDTTNKTYKQLATEITAKSGMNATIEQVGTDAYRLVIKSEDSGIDNKLNISGAASQALGFTTDGSTINSTNHILEAKNMIAKVDGVEYNVATNSITVDGLKMTANKTGASSITIVEDNTQIQTQMQNFVTKYNDLVSMIDTESYNADSAIQDKSSIRNIVSQIKEKLFGSYGTSNDKSVFNYGLELDKSGLLSLNTTKFSDAVQNDLSGLKDLFIGTAENKGLGTTLKETLDNMSYSDGILNIYDSSMKKRETDLTAEKTKAQEALDKKYEQLALQFSSYGTIITQMESSFSGLKMLIDQSNSGN